MKKNITFSSFIIITIILFSSCGSNMSITKRHYNNGYYVSNSKIKHPNEKQMEIEKLAQAKTIESPHFSQNTAEHNASITDSIESPITENNVMITSTNKIEGKAKSDNAIKHAVKQQAKILKHLTEQKKHRSHKINKQSDDSEALSLLWIVIVAILILWLLGFLAGGFGLGGVVHLLLLIAVILLVLWLLRII